MQAREDANLHRLIQDKVRQGKLIQSDSSSASQCICQLRLKAMTSHHIFTFSQSTILHSIHTNILTARLVSSCLELGYDLDYQYKSQFEEMQIKTNKNDLQNQILLDERHELATKLTEKFQMQHRLEQQKTKAEFELKAKQQVALLEMAHLQQ